MTVINAARPSTLVQVDIDSLRADKVQAQERSAALAASYDAVLLTGDEAAADGNVLERARLEREIRRLDLQLPALQAESQDALRRETAERQAKARADANAARDKLIARREKDYDAPARRIGAFVADWQAVHDQCAAVGVETLHALLRYRAPDLIPERTEPYEIYVDEQGNDTSSAFPAGSYRLDAHGRYLDPTSPGKLLAERPKRTRTRIVPASLVGERALDLLPDLVNLPGLSVGDADHCRATGLVRPPQPRR